MAASQRQRTSEGERAAWKSRLDRSPADFNPLPAGCSICQLTHTQTHKSVSSSEKLFTHLILQDATPNGLIFDFACGRYSRGDYL